jgi:hypothetical integral membrane protein (TIGR02206 family)
MDWVGTASEPYGPAHWLMLAITVVGAVYLALLGRRLRGTRAAELFCRGFALSILIVAVGFLVLWSLPGNFNLDETIPLQLSDLLRYVSAWALWSRRRLAVALTYYWGLTLNVQALVTPNLQITISPMIDFSAYWSQHILVMWAAIFLTFGLGLTPNWRDYRNTLLVTVGWAVFTIGVNTVAGTNYGYLNQKPLNPSLLDLMPVWPYYLIIEFVAITVVWALITWPWVIRRRRRTPASPG